MARDTMRTRSPRPGSTRGDNGFGLSKRAVRRRLATLPASSCGLARPARLRRGRCGPLSPRTVLILATRLSVLEGKSFNPPRPVAVTPCRATTYKRSKYSQNSSSRPFPSGPARPLTSTSGARPLAGREGERAAAARARVATGRHGSSAPGTPPPRHCDFLHCNFLHCNFLHCDILRPARPSPAMRYPRRASIATS
jgi:hypothetical protein